MIRFFDITFALLGLILGAPLLLGLLVIGWIDTGSPLFLQERIGRNKKPFMLVKFRTMSPDTASVATHLADVSCITSVGHVLRRTKLDELPQLWNVLCGEMSLVGPRPCLFNQTELIAEREFRGVFDALPGITGLAQINGINMSEPVLLAKIDAEMIASLNLQYYLYYIFFTIFSGKYKK